MINLKLSKRQKDILILLSEQTSEIKGAQLAQNLSISLRTLQHEISIINSINKNSIISSNRLGYKLNKNNLNVETVKENDDFLNLLRFLLLENKKCDLNVLEDELYISSSTLQNRLKQIQKILSQCSLELKKSKNKIWIEGSEINKRKMIKKMIYLDAEPIFISLNSCSEYFKDMDIIRIKEIILQAIHYNSCKVEDVYSTNLIINIIISLYRMRNGFNLTQIDSNICINENDIEYKIANEICKHYSNHWTMSITQEDIYQIASLMVGQIKPFNVTEQINNYSINQEFQNKINNILYRTFQYYMLNIDYSSFLYNFSLHVKSLIKRAKIKQNISNEIASNIRLNCPFIYDVAVHIAKEIEDTFDVEVKDEEIGFISIHIGFVIENSVKDNNKIKVLLICNEYHHIQETILKKLKDNFDKSIQIINIIQSYNSSEVEKADLIISTFPLQLLKVKIVMVSPFLTNEDILKIDTMVKTIQNEIIQTKNQKLLLSFFDEQLFFIHNHFDTKNQVINFLGQKIIDFGLSKEGFIESVHKREKMSSTCFFDTFAIPHPIELNAKKTMFCVLINKKGINWDNHNIHLVFMIAIQQKDRKEFMKIYNGIIQTLCNKEKVHQLIQSNNFNEFIECFKS